MRASSTADPADAYPRPLLERRPWYSLDGSWQFTFDDGDTVRSPDEVQWQQRIHVPFAPETTASGIGDGSFHRRCWYRRTFTAPDLDGGRLLVHFGAVDYEAKVWLNGVCVTQHVGGHTPFTADVTAALRADSGQELIVCAIDEPGDLTKPRGKQDWKLEPHSIWYPRTSGIWQSVWMEVVPRTWIDRLRWTPNLERWEIGLEAWLGGACPERLRLKVRLTAGETLLADDTYTVVAGEVHRAIALSDPGIDDSRNELLWSPASPTLIQAELELWADRGEQLDSVRSYTAIRAVTVQGDRFMLNGRPFQLRLVLDQGYRPDSGLTAPDDAALRRDVELARAMGFNGVRKHQKIESPRSFFWADRLGLMVWEEMPSAYRFTPGSVVHTAREWMEVIQRDYSHPCIVAWVPFNESWGVPNLPEAPAQRHYVRALYHLTRTLDATRPVVGNDGWESVATDIIGIHDYDANPERIGRRYGGNADLPRLFRRERPGGRLLVLERQPRSEHPIVLSEFGGIALSTDPRSTWGYSRVPDGATLARRYEALLGVVRQLDLFAGFCYTQFADTYQETNGLLYADRTPKFPIERMANATMGTSEPTLSPLDRDPGERSPGPVDPET